MASAPGASFGAALTSRHLLQCSHPELVSALTSGASLLSTLAAAVMKSPISSVKPGKPRKKNHGGQCFMTVFKISWKRRDLFENRKQTTTKTTAKPKPETRRECLRSLNSAIQQFHPNQGDNSQSHRVRHITDHHVTTAAFRCRCIW